MFSIVGEFLGPLNLHFGLNQGKKTQNKCAVLRSAQALPSMLEITGKFPFRGS